MDKLTPLKKALDEIVADQHVSSDPIGLHERWRVTLDTGEVVHVHQAPAAFGDDTSWAAFFEGSTPDNPRPAVGLAGSQANRPELVIMWALLD